MSFYVFYSPAPLHDRIRPEKRVLILSSCEHHGVHSHKRRWCSLPLWLFGPHFRMIGRTVGLFTPASPHTHIVVLALTGGFSFCKCLADGNRHSSWHSMFLRILSDGPFLGLMCTHRSVFGWTLEGLSLLQLSALLKTVVDLVSLDSHLSLFNAGSLAGFILVPIPCTLPQQ